MEILQLLCSEGYCYYLDFVNIAYFPAGNRLNVYPPIKNSSVEELSPEDSYIMTGLSSIQLARLCAHLRLPEFFCYERRHRFTGEECLLHYLVFNRRGESKLLLSRNYFGGDPRRFTYSIRMMTNHLYDNFYHKISGDSMRMWIPHIDSFRFAIWQKIKEGFTVEETYDTQTYETVTSRLISLDIPYDAFRIFGFLDDTGFRTTTPGGESRRINGFFDDVQRSFYSGYFAGHGLKVQALTLPNGMIGSCYVGSWRQSDAGMLNMSGLDTYLSSILREFEMEMPGAMGQFPAVYGDGIFPQLSTIVARYSLGNELEGRVNRRLASARQSIEHLFAIHTNIFGLFSIPQRFKLLVHGVECTKMVMNSFFLLNCYTCFNESPNNFDIRPPLIEEYLPLDEALKKAPIVPDNALGEVYQYYHH